MKDDDTSQIKFFEQQKNDENVQPLLSDPKFWSLSEDFGGIDFYMAFTAIFPSCSWNRELNSPIIILAWDLLSFLWGSDK